MQRAAFDMIGVRAEGAADGRPWLRHRAWPSDYFPLRRDSDGAKTFEIEQERYPFVSVSGDGVHEIPVGPIHAGIIEPGHFRFSIVGEKVLRLEERLGYVHKGIEKRFEGDAARRGPSARRTRIGRLDGGLRLGLCDGGEVGDRTAHPVARGLAARAAAGTRARRESPRAIWARSATTRRWRSAWRSSRACASSGCALNAHVFGHRLMMDCIVPGGVGGRSRPHGAGRPARADASSSKPKSGDCERSTTSTPACRIVSRRTGIVDARAGGAARA